jgi:polysaccharide pyruvyl transferase WcaK-like protein
LVICRNEPSRGVLGDLGVRTTSGADTAWTFEPAEPARGAELLRKAGWDGEQKVLIVCPINPFWWPVKPDLLKSMARRFGGQYKKEHYKSIYFHNHSDEVDRKLEAYIDGLAGAVNAFCRDRSVMTVLVGMEKLDRGACELLQSRLKVPAPLFISDEYDMYDLVSVLRNASMLVSSRFHAIVTSMPGLVPSAGVTMDERIRNLMNDRNHPGLFLEVDDENLSEKLLAIIRRLDSDGDAIADQIGRSIPKQLRLMGKMGIDLVDEVARIYPDFPVRNVPREPEQFLPPLSPKLQQLMERYSAE